MIIYNNNLHFFNNTTHNVSMKVLRFEIMLPNVYDLQMTCCSNGYGEKRFIKFHVPRNAL